MSIEQTMQQAITRDAEKRLTASDMLLGGVYNWRHQSEILVYIGTTHYHGNGTWHGFARLDNSTIGTWSEVRADELDSFELTPRAKIPESLASRIDTVRADGALLVHPEFVAKHRYHRHRR
jgi:hypothetical protein